MRQAITTKFLPPTNHRGARILAKAAAGSRTIPWDHAHNVEDNHRLAARVLAHKLEWSGAWHSGELPDGTGYCFVVADGPAMYWNNPTKSDNPLGFAPERPSGDLIAKVRIL